MSKKQKVLFVCVHNSARSQIAEALCNHLCGNKFEAESAGLTPGTLNPLAVEVLAEIGLDISGKQTRHVFDVVKSGVWYQHVVTVCDEASAERCPIFPGVVYRHHWSFPDPFNFQGTHEEKLAQTRRVMELIATKLREWCDEC